MVNASAEVAKNPLVGKFFHRMEEDKTTIKNQGIVEAEVFPGHFLVQFFSFLTGEDTNMEIVPVANMTHWKFYNSNDEMNQAFRDEQRRLGAQIDQNI